MILAVTPNPALDVTYQVDELRRHGLTRVGRAHRQAGGKGVNVARALSRLGCPVRATGFVGGAEGEVIRKELVALEVDERMVEVAGSTRQTITIIEAGGLPTELSEPGPEVDADDWRRFGASFERCLDGVAVVTISGSLPPGSPADGYRRLVAAARAAGCRVLLDASGAGLLPALAAGPDVVTPNRRELFAALGLADDRRLSAVEAACGRLLEAGAGAVVATLGSSGLLAASPAGSFRVSHGRVSGNPVGAGDVLVAVLARGLLLGEEPWDALLRRAAAAAAASVGEPYAGELSLARAERLATGVTSRRLPGGGGTGVPGPRPADGRRR